MTTVNPQNQLKPIDQVRHELKRMETQIQAALPAHIKPEKFVRVAMTALQNTPDLLMCDRTSLFNSVMRCAADGLLPDGRDAAFVKYGSKVQYLPMIGGICKKARNSGEIKTINAAVVCERDDYQYWTDETGEHFKHIKARGDRGLPVITYAYAITKDGGFYFEELTEDEIQAVRNVSRAKDSGPWNGPFADEMRRKTAIRRLAKYRLPSSTDLDDVIRSDDEMYDIEQPKVMNKAEELGKLINTEKPTIDIEPQIETQPKPQIGVVVSKEFSEAAEKAELDMMRK